MGPSLPRYSGLKVRSGWTSNINCVGELNLQGSIISLCGIARGGLERKDVQNSRKMINTYASERLEYFAKSSQFHPGLPNFSIASMSAAGGLHHTNKLIFELPPTGGVGNSV